MKIVKIEFDHSEAVGGSLCDINAFWKVTYDNGFEDIAIINLWYRPDNCILREFLTYCTPENVDNFEEAYIMFIEEANKSYCNSRHQYNIEEQKKYLKEYNYAKY